MSDNLLTTPSPIEVKLEVKPGRAWSRFWASVIDSFIFGIPAYLTVFILSLILGSPISFREDVVKNIEKNPAFGITVLLFYFGYYVYFTVNKGTTFGKDAYGLTVVKYKTQESISYAQAIIREVFKIGILIVPVLGSLVYLINGLIITFSSSKRGIHDRIAGTQVVKIKPAWPMKKQLGCFTLIVLGISLILGIGFGLFALFGR